MTSAVVNAARGAGAPKRPGGLAKRPTRQQTCRAPATASAAKTQSPKAVRRQVQNRVVGKGCIGTLLSGQPCPTPRVEEHLPYCESCMRTGDPSLRVVKHPRFGRCLITRRDLKKGYVVAWWGERIGRKRMLDERWEWALESSRGVIDAVPFGPSSPLQFCQCPGPSEIPTIDEHPSQYDKLLKQKPKTCLLFGLLCDVPKNHQLTMMYNKDEKTTEVFFKERDIVRVDVSCAAYPALKKPATKRMRK
eukprot:TRINITY_DN52034_c0_g1_i1.p1 TRINITY_DN52034_c0_g1~~TRINITY_DN52034_c0_g1_i1.p1  ORF type:complete len:264 (-),score=32.14 TRINITY_DN52034_c0_g1_i1:293-1036(-)